MSDVKELTNVAENFGLSQEFIAEVLSKYGPEVLSVCIEGLKNGFSVGFVIELVRLFGPVVLDFILSLFKKSNKTMQMAEAHGMGASDQSLADFLNDKNAENFAPILMKLLVEKLIPYVIKNYGDQIVHALLEAMQKAFNDKESARFLTVPNNVKA